MITVKEITEILSLYKKHGWNISRVLLCVELRNLLEDDTINELFDGAEIIESKANGVWFSRPSKHGKTAWELRHLSAKPFAIFELFDEDTDRSTKMLELKKIENRLIEYASNKRADEKV